MRAVEELSRPAGLRVSKDLELPRQFVTHRNALLGMSGSGKSNASAVMAEEMFRLELPWIAIDPKGDGYGIRSSRDGKKPGLDVPIIGGEHGDLPLLPTQGKRMGELVAEGKLTGIFDLSSFETDGDRARFMADFGRALFRGRTTPIHIFCDECHEYMPQPGAGGRLEGPAADCVGVWKRILTQGRQRGIGVTLASQRTAQVNKTCLYQCETLIAMRTMGKLDRKAIEQWVDQVGDAQALLEALPRLADGEAFVWSPMRLKIERRITFRLRETYDSGRTPEVGETVVAPKLADLDLAALRAELAPVLDDQEDETPSERERRPNGKDQQLGELRGRIAELERELEAKPGFDEARAARMHSDVGEAIERARAAVGARFDEALREVNQIINPYRRESAGEEVGHRDVKPSNGASRPPAREIAPEHSAPAPAAAKPNGASGVLSKCARLILTALYQHGDLSLVQAAIIAGYASDSGGVRNAAGELRAFGFVEGSNAALGITDPGCEEVRDAPKLPKGPKLAEYWFGKLDRAERLILGEVLAAYPGKLALKDAAKRAGYEPSSGGVAGAAGKLRMLCLVHGGNSGMQADRRLV